MGSYGEQGRGEQFSGRQLLGVIFLRGNYPRQQFSGQQFCSWAIVVEPFQTTEFLEIKSASTV